MAERTGRIQEMPVTRIETRIVSGTSRKWKVMDELNTFTDTACANAKPKNEPSSPPIPPSKSPSPMNSMMIEPSDAPSAFLHF